MVNGSLADAQGGARLSPGVEIKLRIRVHKRNESAVMRIDKRQGVAYCMG
jgi:hypothetical protein